VATPLAARVAQDCGLQAIAIGGYAQGAITTVSEPLLSLEEVAQLTRAITLVCDLPLLVDAGAGWGEPIHVAHTTRTLEQAGAAAIHLEDQAYPKRASYHRGIEEIISKEDMLVKLRTALDVRKEMLIVARCDALRTHGYDEAMDRAHAYVNAGADAIVLFPNDEEETRRAPKDLPGVPLIYVNSTGNKFGRGVYRAAQLEEWGWSVLEDAISSSNVVFRALRELFTSMVSTGEAGLDPEEITEVRTEMERVVGLDAMYAMEDATVLAAAPSADVQ
jgi:methylisocitrate lyase